MADRNLNFSPRVNSFVPENVEGGVLETVAQIGNGIAEVSTQGKLMAATAKASAGLKNLDSQYRLQWAHDPTNEEGLAELKEKRSQLIDEIGKGVPLIGSRTWQDKATQLSLQSDASNEVWGQEQKVVNTVNDVNDSIQTYLGNAVLDGQAYGKNGSAELSSALGYMDAVKDLQTFGMPILGQQKMGDLLKGFQGDYIKTFVTGVVESNPSKALQLLDNNDIKQHIPPEQYIKFRSAVENRAKHVMRMQGEAQVLTGLKTENNLLARGGQANYTDLQQTKMSEPAREYFESLNGFRGSGKRGGFTPEDKAGFQMAIFDSVTKLSKDPNIDAQSVRVVQDAVYKAMNAGAITQDQGLGYVKQILDPMIAKKEKTMATFGKNTWGGDDIGFDGIQEFYDANVRKPIEGLSKDELRSVQVSNRVNKANLYDYYWGALEKAASSMNKTVAELGSLPQEDRMRIYSAAQTSAQATYLRTRYPALRTLPDTPNMVLDLTGMVQGVLGERNLKPQAKVASPFKLQHNPKTGQYRRVYADGRTEAVDGPGK